MNPLSGVFGEAWELYKAHWRHFFSIALLVFVVLAALVILLTFLLGWFGVIISVLITIAFGCAPSRSAKLTCANGW